MLLIDASAWVSASDLGDRFHASASVLAVESAEPVAALDLTLYEVANVIGARDGRPDDAGALNRLILKRCGRLVAVDLELIEMAVEIASELELTAYDAAYVAAARRHGWKLVSTDLRDLVSRGLAVTPDAAV